MANVITFASVDERLNDLAIRAGDLKDKVGWKDGFDAGDACGAIMETCEMVKEMSALLRQLATLTMLAVK